MHFQIRIKRLLNSLLDLLGHMVHSLGSSSLSTGGHNIEISSLHNSTLVHTVQRQLLEALR